MHNLARSTAASTVYCAGAVRRATSLAGAKSAVVGERNTYTLYPGLEDYSVASDWLWSVGRIATDRRERARVTVQEIATGA